MWCQLFLALLAPSFGRFFLPPHQSPTELPWICESQAFCFGDWLVARCHLNRGQKNEKKSRTQNKALLHLLFTLLYSLGSPHEHRHCRSEDGWWHPLETWRSWLNPSPGVHMSRVSFRNDENMAKSTSFLARINKPSRPFQCCSLPASFSSFCVCSSLSGLGDSMNSIFRCNPFALLWPSFPNLVNHIWPSFHTLPTFLSPLTADSSLLPLTLPKETGQQLQSGINMKRGKKAASKMASCLQTPG